MKIKCNREGLLTAFQVVVSVAPARSPKPILRNVKLSVSGTSDAVLAATDLELGIRYKVSGVTVDEEGDVVLPSSELAAILRELSDETITLERRENGVRVSAASSRFDLSAEDPLQFPEVPDFGESPVATIRAEAFAQMIRRTVFAVASENSRYALHSVLIELTSEQANLVATDGKRLAFMPGPVNLLADPPKENSLIPPKALQLVSKVLQDPSEELQIALRSNEVLFRTGKVTIYSRLVEGRFPRYQDVFPAEAKIRIPLPAGALLGVVRQAKIVTSDESRAVDFRFENGVLTLESQAADRGESEIRMPVGYDGDPITVVYDPGLLIDALRVIEPEEEITLELVDSKRASVFRTRDKYAYIVMPLTRERG